MDYASCMSLSFSSAFFQLSPTMVAVKLIILFFLVSNNVLPVIPCFTAIFSFGDSLADTGNRLFSAAGDDQSGRPPYGETYFHRPSGRFSNGRLVVDFLAQSLGVPLLPPYLAGPTGQHNFRRGVNFAVGGATALGNDLLREKGLHVNWTDYSLGTQMQWFKQLMPLLCHSKRDCDSLLRNSLFLVGEIGGNDYNYGFWQNITFGELESYVPLVISAMSSAINGLIELGARTLVVPGNFPIGCVSLYLAIFQTKRTEDYDPQTGCIKWLNEFSQSHNLQLKHELENLRRRHSDATIIYADNYEVVMNIFRSPIEFGFKDHALSACCGGTGSYNCNSTILCGEEGSMLCDDPSRYVCWDGVHYTEAANRIIADGLINGPYAVPSISSLCSDKSSICSATNSIQWYP